MRVAVLGTGIMGAPMARNLAAAGHDVRAWNRSPEKAEGIDGVEAVREIGEAVRGADAVVTMLSDAGAVEAVVREALPHLDGSVLVQMSTIGPEATARLRAQEVQPFVDAPVLGTKAPAEQGKLIVLASGPEDQRERLAPVFDAVGAKTLWLGEAGAGSRLKLVLNTWLLGADRGPRRGDRAGRGARRRPADVPRHDRRRAARRALREPQGQADDRGRLPALVPARAGAQGRAARARRGRASTGCGSARWRRSRSRCSARSRRATARRTWLRRFMPAVADALIIVDYQNDFARPDGALSVPAGEEVAAHINELAASGDYDARRRDARLAPARPRLVHRAGRHLARALRAGQRGRRAARRARHRPGRRDRRQGPGPGHRGLLGVRRDRAWRRPCALAGSTASPSSGWRRTTA